MQVSWPAPERIVEADGIIIGYRNERACSRCWIEPKDANQPVVLRLAIDYAICEKVCIPVQAKAELKIKGGGTAEAAIVAAEKTVPRALPLGADAPLSVKAIRRDDAAKPARVLVDVAAPEGSRSRSLRKGRRRIGRCRSPTRSMVRPRACSASPSRSTACRPAASDKGAAIKADGGRRRPRRSRPPSGSTNASAAAYFAATCPAPVAAGAIDNPNDVTIREDSMAIKVGDTLPNATFRVMTPEGPKPKTTDEVFKGKKVVLFAVPGAFTPTCHKNHLPGFVHECRRHQGQGHRRDRGHQR